jgi:hypothetical protein
VFLPLRVGKQCFLDTNLSQHGNGLHTSDLHSSSAEQLIDMLSRKTCARVTMLHKTMSLSSTGVGQ